MYWIDISSEWQDRPYIGQEIDTYRAVEQVLRDAKRDDLATWAKNKIVSLEVEYIAPFSLEIIY